MLLALLLFSIPPLIAWVIMVGVTFWLYRDPDERPRNACVRCGYDFLALGRAEVCPECGAGRYDQAPRWEVQPVRWIRSALAIAATVVPAPAIWVLFVMGVPVDAAVESVAPGRVGRALTIVLFVAGPSMHAHNAGSRSGATFERWVVGHLFGLLAVLLDAAAMGMIALSDIG